MNNTEHGTIGHNHEGHNHEGHNHDMHTVLSPAHDVFNDLLKENIKSKFVKNKDVMKEVDKLGDMGYNLFLGHLDSIFEEITTNYDKNSESH